MGFDDVARRMRERHAGQGPLPPPPPPGATPELMQADALRAERQSRAKSDITIGLVLLVLGVVITAATYSSASRQGGTYIIAYGPIVWGFIRLMRGFMNLGG